MEEFKTLMGAIETHFYKPDIQAARIIMASAAAHYIPKLPPIWMFVVGPPSSGKTSITVEALSGLQGMFGPNQPWGPSVDSDGTDDRQSNPYIKDQDAVEILSTINANTFLSHQIVGKGMPPPGLLEQLNKNGPTKEKGGTREMSRGNILILIPDFTVLSSMRKDMRGEIIGQLRRMYDGEFEKKIGTAVMKMWEGKMSILAATTPSIDKYTSIDSQLGERFIQLKWRASDDINRSAFAINQLMHDISGKKPMKDGVRKLFASCDYNKIMLDLDQRNRMAAMSELIAIARTSVYGRKDYDAYVVEEVSCSEDTYRTAIQFYAILCGLCAIQHRTTPIEQDFQDVLRVVVESMNTHRSVVFQAAIESLPLTAFQGRHKEKCREAQSLYELGMIQKCHIGSKDQIVKLTPKFEAVVERCQFEPGCFLPDGQVAGDKRAKRASDVEAAVLGAHDSVF